VFFAFLSELYIIIFVHHTLQKSFASKFKLATLYYIDAGWPLVLEIPGKYWNNFLPTTYFKLFI